MIPKAKLDEVEELADKYLNRNRNWNNLSWSPPSPDQAFKLGWNACAEIKEAEIHKVQLDKQSNDEDYLRLSVERNTLQSEITTLKEQLAEARGVIEFYGCAPNYDVEISGSCPMFEDTEDFFGNTRFGKLARCYLSKYPLREGNDK